MLDRAVAERGGAEQAYEFINALGALRQALEASIDD